MFRAILTTLLAVAVTTGISYAMVCHGQGQTQQIAQQESSEHNTTGLDAVTKATPKVPVNVGNKICPVSGEKIDEKLKADYEYQGKVYNLCCSACTEEFKKDPQKYIKKVDDELKSQPSMTQDSGQTRQENAH